MSQPNGIGSVSQRRISHWRTRLRRAPRVASDYLRGLAGLATIRRRFSARVGVLCLIDLVQDLDVLLPVARAAKADDRFEVRLVMTDWLDDAAPGASARLSAAGLAPIRHSRRALRSIAPDLRGWDALLTASESTAAPHRFAHALTKRANAAGLATFTLQHGLENVGLTLASDEEIGFASHHILTWGDPADLPASTPASVRARCIGVGRPIPVSDSASALPISAWTDKPLIAIFENLHWTRYDDAYRERFVRDLKAAAATKPDVLFLIKPHPAGQWAAAHQAIFAQVNAQVIVADPDLAEWRGITAADIIDHAAAIITTPSTIALDAALRDRPVAVAAYGAALEAYTPLPLLNESADWIAFIDAALRRVHSGEGAAFRRRHVLPGDAVTRIMDAIADGGRKTPRDLENTA